MEGFSEVPKPRVLAHEHLHTIYEEVYFLIYVEYKSKQALPSNVREGDVGYPCSVHGHGFVRVYIVLIGVL